MDQSRQVLSEKITLTRKHRPDRSPEASARLRELIFDQIMDGYYRGTRIGMESAARIVEEASRHPSLEPSYKELLQQVQKAINEVRDTVPAPRHQENPDVDGIELGDEDEDGE